jgi:hypothetical protein
MSLRADITNILTPGSIESLKSTIAKHSGLARPNRFAVFITPPQRSLFNINAQDIFASVVSDGFDVTNLINDPRDVALLCESCAIPGRQITTLDYDFGHYGQSVKKPSGFLNDDIQLSFHLTNDYYVRKMFDQWIDLIMDRKSYKLRYDSAYKSDITIQQLNEKNVPVYGVKLKNAYPTTIQNTELNNSSSNETQKLNVTVTYEDFEVEGTIQSAISSIQNSIKNTTLKLPKNLL